VTGSWRLRVLTRYDPLIRRQLNIHTDTDCCSTQGYMSSREAQIIFHRPGSCVSSHAFLIKNPWFLCGNMVEGPEPINPTLEITVFCQFCRISDILEGIYILLNWGESQEVCPSYDRTVQCTSPGVSSILESPPMFPRLQDLALSGSSTMNTVLCHTVGYLLSLKERARSFCNIPTKNSQLFQANRRGWN